MLNFEGIGIPLLTIEKNEKTEKEKKEKKVIVSIGEYARNSVESIELCALLVVYNRKNRREVSRLVILSSVG